MDTLPEEKIQFIDHFLNLPLIARLATSDEQGQPHVVPVWFGWDGKTLWISSYSNTRKVKDLQQNPRISVVIDIEENHETKAVVLEGSAELIEQPRDFLKQQFLWIYKRYMGEDGVKEEQPQEWIEDAHNLLIKLTPSRIMTWNW